jgi:hypothetical protein
VIILEARIEEGETLERELESFREIIDASTDIIRQVRLGGACEWGVTCQHLVENTA